MAGWLWPQRTKHRRGFQLTIASRSLRLTEVTGERATVLWRRTLSLSLNAAGGAFGFTGRLGKALRCHGWALRVAGNGSSLGLLRATTLVRLGVVNKTAGNYAVAAECYGRAVALLDGTENVPAGFWPAIAHNLAGLALAEGDFLEAEVHANRAVEARITTRAPLSMVAQERVVLGASLAAQSRDDEARVLFLDALAVLERTLGSNHYEVGVVHQHLGVLEQRRSPSAALGHYERALSIKQRTRGLRHPEVGIVHNNLGTLHREQGRDDVAASHYRIALRLLRRYGPDHPATRTCRANLERVSHDKVRGSAGA